MPLPWCCIGPLTKLEIAGISAVPQLAIPVLALNNQPLAQYTPVTNLYYFGIAPENELRQLVDRLRRKGYSQCAVVVDESKNSQHLWRLLQMQLGREHSLGGKSLLGVSGGASGVSALGSGQPQISSLMLRKKANLSQQICRFLSKDANASLCDSKLRRKLNSQRENGASSLARQDLEAVVLLTEPSTTAQLVPLLRFYYLEDRPLLAPSSSYDLSLNLADLEGLEFLDMPFAVRPALWPAEHEASSGAGANTGTPGGGKYEIGRGSGRSGSSLARRLYAMGADAYWAANHFYQLIGHPAQVWQGASGRIQLLENNLIWRQLDWWRVRKGRLERIDYD